MMHNETGALPRNMTFPSHWIRHRAGAALPGAQYLVKARAITTSMARKGLFLVLLAAGFAAQPGFAADSAAQLPNPEFRSMEEMAHTVPSVLEPPSTQGAYQPKRANFDQASPSRQAREVADWALDSGDHRGLPFAIVDKAEARVFVFNAAGQLSGATPALLGLALGDDSVPGIGERKLSSIRPDERTTAAGRFVASLDHNLQGKEILWVDYDAAISLHPVVTSNAKERRAERLASSSPSERRISYGCINVPVQFFKNVVSPAFTGTDGIVYVLPETRSAREVFGSYDVEEHARLKTASQAVPAPVVAQAAR